MIKVFMPGYCQEWRGWLGRYQYARFGCVYHAYPIGFLNRYFIPSQYYSPKGWIYQTRRTWHGVTNIAMRAGPRPEPGTPYQLQRWSLFYNAVKAWQSMSQEVKDIYHHWTHPARASGYNRFLSFYLLHTPLPIIPVAFTIQKALQYTILTTLSAITKSLQYAVIVSQTIQKSLQYTVVHSVDAITKSLQYTVVCSISAIQKTLEYAITTANYILLENSDTMMTEASEYLIQE